MTAMSAFTMLMQSVGESWPKNTKRRVNDAVRNTTIWGRYINAKDVESGIIHIQGGTRIRHRIMLDYTSNWAWIDPDATTTPSNNQSGTNLGMDWAFARTYAAWNDTETLLSEKDYSRDYLKQVFMEMMVQKMQDVITDAGERLDDTLIGVVPNYNLMESATPSGPRRMMSLHAIVNEYNTTNTPYTATPTGAAPKIGGLQGAGLIPSEIDGGGVDWTDVHDVNPLVAPNFNWRPYQDTYGTWQNVPGSSAIEQAALVRALFTAFDRAFMATKLDQVTVGPNMEAGEDVADETSKPNAIYTSMNGITYYNLGLLGNQSYFFGMGQRGGQDPHYDAAKYDRVELVYASALNAIPLYLNAGLTAGVTETDSTSAHTGPRYIGVNGRYIKPYVQDGKFFEMKAPVNPDGQPENWVQYIHLWGGLGAISRRRHFHIRPVGASAA